MILKGKWFGILLLAAGVLYACSRDELIPPEACETMTPTYEGNIKDIINQTCAYSGCHDGSGGIGPGDYTSFAGLEPELLSGNFTDRVLSQRNNPSRGMPPNKSVYPESQQDDLSPIQLEIIQCWIQNGFPEN